ncbi:MAG: hypothetical protein JXJ04_12945 [Spirochaetales bacterium]|nr:hypothetical protein [Spirochaetales bacterium]
MKVMHIFIIFLILFLAGCSSVTENVIKTTIDKADYKKIEEIDLLILRYRITEDISYLVRAESDVKELMTNKAYNNEYEAVLFGYAGEIDFLKGDSPGVKKNLKEVEKRSRFVEYFFILSALDEKDYEKKIEILKQGLTLANTTGKINLYLALFYFEHNDYLHAAASFDDAFELLDPAYPDFYKKQRNLAYQQIENPRTDETKKLLEVEIISFSHVISLTLKTTDFLDYITVDKKINPASLFVSLKKYGYIHDSIESIEDVCARKDVAYFLLSIISYLENAPDIKTTYQNQYIANGLPSPVPDVAVEDYCFSAVLVLVEREIMELPNGIHFLPHKTMSGMEFNELLNKIRNRYF